MTDVLDWLRKRPMGRFWIFTGFIIFALELLEVPNKPTMQSSVTFFILALIYYEITKRSNSDD